MHVALNFSSSSDNLVEIIFLLIASYGVITITELMIKKFNESKSKSLSSQLELTNQQVLDTIEKVTVRISSYRRLMQDLSTASRTNDRDLRVTTLLELYDFTTTEYLNYTI